MATSLTFAGKTSRIPAVAVMVDDSGITPFNAGDQPIVGIVGIGQGGTPKLPTLFSSPSQANAIIRGGELLTGIQKAFAGGAPLVYGVRVNPATQAAVTLNDGSAAPSIDLKSTNYGTLDNLLAAKVETGTAAGTKKVSFRQGTATYVRDSIGRDLLSLQYTGAGTACTLTITATTLTTAVTGGPGGENLSLTLANYPTLYELYNAIAGLSAYTITMLATNPSQPVNGKLDALSAVAIKASAGKITANLEEIIYWINSLQNFIVASRATNASAVPANTNGWVPLTGAVEGTTTTTDWQAAIDALENLAVTFIVPMTSDAVVHDQLKTHVVSISGEGLRPRIGFVGAALGEKTADLSNYLTRARALNSDRMVLVPMGIVQAASDGTKTTLPPYMTAAQVAGLQAGVPEIGTSITNAGVAAASLEWLPTRGDLELGIAGGLCMIMQDRLIGGFRIARAITTWLQNQAYHRVEISTRIALDEVLVRVINGLQVFIGQKSTLLTAKRAISQTETILRGMIDDQIISNFSNVFGTVVLGGDKLSIEFQVAPVISINFIPVTVHAETVTGVFSFETAV